MTDFFIRFEHLYLLGAAAGLLVFACALRRWWYQRLYYRYSLASALPATVYRPHPHQKIIGFLRIATLALLAFLAGQPQLVDPNSRVTVEGIDIVLVLDVSGSMQAHDNNQQLSRIEIAKHEAIRFVRKRTNDAIGLVLFGKSAVTRCPITYDRKMLTDIIQETQLGVIEADGTALVTGMICAANRLKRSQAKSKIMIVLTDGEPSEHDMAPDVILKVAAELGIKIYTIGIGSDQDQMVMVPMYGVVQQLKVNKALLEMFAHKTGGKFFMAHDRDDMRTIYDTINTLETVKHDVPIFSYWIELIYPLIFVVLALLCSEIFLSTFVWFCL